MAVMFFGSGLFPLRMFQRLSALTEIQLMTIPNRDKQREKNQIKEFAKQENLKIFDQFPIMENYQLGFVCNYGQMIPDNIIDRFQNLYVIHPSLLPALRGAAPIQRALIRGLTETGISFIEISKNKFDAGPILLQKTIPINPNDRYLELADKLSILAADNMEYFYKNHKNLIGSPQTNTGSNAPKIKQIFVNFDQTAKQAYNLYRGIYGTNFKSVKLQYADKQMYIEQASLVEEELPLLNRNSINGSIRILKGKFRKNIYIQFNEGWLRLEKFRFIDRNLVQDSYTLIDQYKLNNECYFVAQRSTQ